eukprot:m.97742 g.97742  ORF g.97742 m.97742 type:complete len:597 (+) comp12406_c0_seq2:363-2153(+)
MLAERRNGARASVGSEAASHGALGREEAGDGPGGRPIRLGPVKKEPGELNTSSLGSSSLPSFGDSVFGSSLGSLEDDELDMSAMAEQLRLTTPQLHPEPRERRPSDDRMSLYLQVFASQGSTEDELAAADTFRELADTLSPPAGRRISFSAGSKRPRAPSGTEQDYAEVIRQLGLEQAAEEQAQAQASAGLRRPEQQRRRAEVEPEPEPMAMDAPLASVNPMTSLRLPRGRAACSTTHTTGGVVSSVASSVGPAAAAAPRGGGPRAAAGAHGDIMEFAEVDEVAGLVRNPIRTKGLQWASNVIRLAEHPAPQGRFRYAKEKRRTALPGRSPRSVPTIEVTPEWRGRVPEGSAVTATVVSRHVNQKTGLPLPHWHHFDDAAEEQTVVPLEGGLAEFPSLVVIRGDRAAHESSCAEESGGKGSRYSSDDQQVIRILFTLRFVDVEGRALLAHVVSEPVYSSELKIVEMSHQQVSAANGMDLIVLTSKVKKATAFIKITDPRPPDWVPDLGMGRGLSGGFQGLPQGKPATPDGWSLDEHNQPTCLIQPSYVHYQCSLSVRIPPYWHSGLRGPHQVEVRLVDSSQGHASAPVTLEYVPYK